MITITRTTSNNKDFTELVQQLDADLQIRDGDDHAFYAQFNKTATLQEVVVAYDGDEPVGSGAIRRYTTDTTEIKRMYVVPSHRGKGIASLILAALETWSRELGFTSAILETGVNQPEAIRLYQKNNYHQIENYGQYKNMAASVCFKKRLND
jgi:putative acetyltransferase